jgi:aspartyl/glutamyl-tRNA(Asn/Gln) amidotransferase C subunit
MVPLTRDDILKLAHLSQIDLTDSEIDHLVHDITRVLSYGAFLADRASKGTIIPKSECENRLRDDISRPGLKDDMLACAPQTDGDFFIVPRVLKGS